MESFNIPYRRLRDNTRAKTGKTSPSLLEKHTCKHMNEENLSKGKEFSMMTQNVTRYEHMLKHPHTKENYIDWIVKLREPIQTNDKAGESTENAAPSVFNKTTESRENHLKAKKLLVRSFNSADFYEVLSRKECNKHIEDKTLGFMTSLRGEVLKRNNGSEKSQFSNIPFKDRNEFPTFLSKESMKITKEISKKEKETAFDGAQNFPSYPSKITQEKNFGLLETFTNANIKNRSSMPTIAWQMGLRS